jgi:hypothetical protein
MVSNVIAVKIVKPVIHGQIKVYYLLKREITEHI